MQQWIMNQFISASPNPTACARKFLPQTYLLAAILTTLLIHFSISLPSSIPLLGRLMGFIPITLGIILNKTAEVQFKKFNTTMKSLETPSALVAEGVFSLSRNPMYLGMLFIAAGVAIIEGNLASLLPTPALAFFLNFHFIRPEEEAIENIFGESARNYKKKIRKWI